MPTLKQAPQSSLSLEIQNALLNCQLIFMLIGEPFYILDTFQDHPLDHPLAKAGDVAIIVKPQRETESVLAFMKMVLGKDFALSVDENSITLAYQPSPIIGAKNP